MVLGFDSQSFRGWECQEEEKRWSTDACFFFYCFFSLPFFFYHFVFFSFLLWFFFFFFSYSPLRGFLFLFMATSLPFILLDSMGFLPFVPKASSTIFSFLWAFLEDYPLTHRLPGHYLCSKCACCTTLHSRTELFVLFLPLPLFVLPAWIRIGGSLSLYYPYGMHQVTPALCLPLLGEIPSQQSIFPKRNLDGNSKIDPFSPHH